MCAKCECKNLYGATTFGTRVDVEEGIVPEIGDRGSGEATWYCQPAANRPGSRSRPRGRATLCDRVGQSASTTGVDALDKKEATRMLETAREYVGDNVYVPWDFDDVDVRVFLRQYLWTIYVAGFRNSVVEKHFNAISLAFHDLHLEKIVAMESIDASTLPIRHQRKADAFLRGCKLIHAEGWQAFKERVAERGRAALQELPYMGPATSQHMALALGIEDTEKADTWIKQCAAACSASVDQMVTFLSREHGLTRQQVDGYLWQFCRDNQRLP